MSIDDLKQRIHDLRQLQEAIMDMNYHIETVEDLCGQVGIEGSHHADIEYGRTEIAVDEALHTLEDKLSDLGVTI
tara:strand:- start:1696 stop:1920 length:225 start_codon:yes stop_codon:yes gene_type:complete